MLILVTNDDGYRSEGIKALAEAAKRLGSVVVVAPVDEASAIGHALTLKRPLRLEAIGDAVYAVDGTPTDCVNIAVTQVFKRLPDLVLSGHQQGLQPGRRCDVLGDRGGGSRGGAARGAGSGGVAACDARDL